MRKKEYSFLKFFGGICLILLFTLNVSPWVVVNFSEVAFDKEYQEDIEYEIMVGAANLLDSYSEVLNLFQRIELAKLAQLDFDELKIFVDTAVLKLENARDAYSRLNQKAASAAYNSKIIHKLVIFDFINFQNKRELNKENFSKVSSYLRQGDVRGAYYNLLIDVETMLNTLYTIKNSIDVGNVPEVSVLWSLNRLYSRTLMFGQYTANVFYKITGK